MHVLSSAMRYLPLIALCILAGCQGWQKPSPPRPARSSAFHTNKLQAIGEAVGEARATGELPGGVLWIDHNGATFFQHERFAKMLRGELQVEVSLQDGLRAVLMGLAAHRSILTGESIDLTQGEFHLN